MAVRYAYETRDSNGESEQHRMKMVIPESPEEEVHGETFDQNVIDWLHSSEQQNAQRYAVLAGKEFVSVWTEKVKEQ